MKCLNRKCRNTATHRAQLVLLPPKGLGEEAAYGDAALFSCDKHADDAHALAILHQSAKAQIENTFVSAKKFPPCWERSYAQWVPLAGKTSC